MSCRDLNKNGITVVSSGLKQVSVSTGSKGQVSAPRNQVSLGAVLQSPIGFVSVKQNSKTVFVKAYPGPQGTQGIPGPIGPSGSKTEEEEVYSTRVDFINDNLLYRGEAAVGSSESDPKWRIRRITLGDDGDVTEVWANGNANFTNVWDNRVSITYN